MLRRFNDLAPRLPSPHWTCRVMLLEEIRSRVSKACATARSCSGRQILANTDELAALRCRAARPPLEPCLRPAMRALRFFAE